MATNWTKISSNPGDVQRINRSLHRLHGVHGARYGRHSLYSLGRFMAKRRFDRVVGGALTSIQTPRVYMYDHEVKDKLLSAFYFLRPSTPKQIGTNKYEQDPPLAYCLTLAAPNKFPPPPGPAANGGTDPAVMEMLREINANCLEVMAETGLPIEIICEESVYNAQNGYPTNDPVLKPVWDLALQLTTDPENTSTPFLHLVEEPYQAEPPYPSTTVYRWIVVPDPAL